MYKYIIISCLFLWSAAAYGQELWLRDTVVQYDTIVQGSDGRRYLTIWNVGDAPLLINQCSGNGPTYAPREPIMPGDSARIGVVYDTKRLGPFKRYFWFTTTCRKREGRAQFFYIKGYVREK